MSDKPAFADRFKAVAGDKPHAWGNARGLDKAFIANCLRGTSRPQKKNLDRLVAATGIPEEWWLHGDLPPPTPSIKINVAWPADRRQELKDLQTLLDEVSSINNGSGCLDRISKCIALADKLRHTDFNTGRNSFVQFLIAKATAPITEFKE